MNKTARCSIALLALLLVPIVTMAGIPPITVTLQAGATTSLPKGGAGSANYLVRLDPQVPASLNNMTLSGGLTSGVTQIINQPSACNGNPVCTRSFSLNPGGSCCLMLRLSGSDMTLGTHVIAPVVSSTPATYSGVALPLNITVRSGPTPPPPPSTPSLNASTTSMALSVTGLNLNGSSSGQSRVVTLSNPSNAQLTGLSINYPTWPTGTTTSSTCGATLNAGSSCTITVIPGVDPSSGAGAALCSTGIAPIPSTISVSATSVPSININVVILSYGCLYQGGYLFSIDDSPAVSTNIGGKVVAQTNQTAFFWNPNNISIWGIDDSSTVATPSPNSGSTHPATFIAGQLNCDGVNDGACNTHNIVVYDATNSDTSAASFCNTTIAGHTDWYLPAACELGPFGSGVSYPHNTVPASQTCSNNQNIQNQLAGPGIVANLLGGNFWSSTEDAQFSNTNAWYQHMASGGSDFQATDTRLHAYFVRCARTF